MTHARKETHQPGDTAAEVSTRVDVLVIGGGPAGLMAAEAAAKVEPSLRVRVVDAQRSPGRKFLLAGRSGLNLSNDEPIADFLTRVSGSAEMYVRRCIEQFPPEEMRRWADGLGEATFVGSSGRIFPQSMRATPLLRAWLHRLDELGVELTTEWRADIGSALMIHPHTNSSSETRAIRGAERGAIRVVLDGTGRRSARREVVETRTVVLALGGASWPRTGSDGAWLNAFQDAGVATQSLAASNVGVRVSWSQVFLERHEGEPIKNVALICGERTTVGDIVITRAGVEGGPVYALSAALRAGNPLVVNLRPDVSPADTERALGKARPADSLSNRLRKAGLSRSAAGLLVECGAREAAQDPARLASLVHRLEIPGIALGDIGRAIGSAGGIAGGEIDDVGMLLRHPGVFVAGEMLDWEAPTGGYLLQGCWSTGCRAGTASARYLAP